MSGVTKGDVNTIVEFAGVQKTYDGEQLIVKNLHLDIAKGEFLTLLAPTGSGKTTCLMMLAGVEVFPAKEGSAKEYSGVS